MTTYKNPWHVGARLICCFWIWMLCVESISCWKPLSEKQHLFFPFRLIWVDETNGLLVRLGDCPWFCSSETCGCSILKDSFIPFHFLLLQSFSPNATGDSIYFTSQEIPQVPNFTPGSNFRRAAWLLLLNWHLIWPLPHRRAGLRKLWIFKFNFSYSQCQLQQERKDILQHL